MNNLEKRHEEIQNKPFSPLSKSLKSIKMSPIVTISELAKEKAVVFKAEHGEDFVYFQRGDIDFSTPAYIVEAAKRALDAGLTKYPKSGGESILKDAILAKMERFNLSKGLKQDHVLVTYGGQEALQLAFKLFEGRKGAGFAPCWSCALENFVPYSQIQFGEVPLNPDFSVDWGVLEEVIRDVDFFYLNTPQNPTGKVFTEAEVRRISDLCKKYSVYLISDEAYERIVFDGQTYFSPSSLDEKHIISCFTLSKTYAMTGWRIGYMVCRDESIIQLGRLGDYSQTAGVVTFLQYAAAEAFNNVQADRAAIDPMMIEYKRRRDFLYEQLCSIEGISLTKPQGAFYLFPNFSRLIPANLTGKEREQYVFEKLMVRGVAVVYGSCFGRHFGDNIRISYSATPMDRIEVGVKRIKEVFG